jgi:hypothetical protein
MEQTVLLRAFGMPRRALQAQRSSLATANVPASAQSLLRAESLKADIEKHKKEMQRKQAKVKALTGAKRAREEALAKLAKVCAAQHAHIDPSLS